MNIQEMITALTALGDAYGYDCRVHVMSPRTRKNGNFYQWTITNVVIGPYDTVETGKWTHETPRPVYIWQSKKSIDPS